MSAVALRRLAASRRAQLPAVVPSMHRQLQRRMYSDPARDPQLGDYPDIPPVYRGYLPPLGWWDNLTRRNFGDLLHPEDELYSMWGPDPPKVPARQAFFHFSLAVAAFGGIMLFAYEATPERKAVPRQYPFDGLVNDLGGLEENKARPESLEGEDEE
ncbi:hypothetical protein ACEPAI_6866 [Sanghuangporus weigelae]